MRLIVCLDDRNGMSFNGRRQSSDQVLYVHISGMVQGHKLYLNGYSAPLFSDLDANVHVDECFLQIAGEDDFCFAENLDVSAYTHRCSEVVIYRWNRCYPGDLFFPTEMLSGMLLVYSEEFKGSSHERITQEVYRT